MKRDDLLKTIRKAARTADVDFELVREGGQHTVYRYGKQQFSVPRHREINEITARAILNDLNIR